MPTTTKTVKGTKYLYYFHHDGKGKKVETYCGRADDPEAVKKALKLEREHLVERAEAERKRGDGDMFSILGKASGVLAAYLIKRARLYTPHHALREVTAFEVELAFLDFTERLYPILEEGSWPAKGFGL